MIDVFELYEELCGSVNTQQGGHVRPERNFIQWLNSISLSLYEEKFIAWSKSQKIVDDLSKPFLKSVNIQVAAVGTGYGVAAFPPDYGHFSAARHLRSGEVISAQAGLETYDHCGKKVELDKSKPAYINQDTWDAMQSQLKAEGKPVMTIAIPGESGLAETTIELISNDRWGAVLTHRFSKPTLQEPKMTQYEAGFKIAPSGVSMIVLDYLRRPTPATFEYSVAPGDPLTGKGEYLIYDKVNSKPVEWSELVRNEIMVRLEKKFGKYIREDFIWQTSEADRKSIV